MNSFIKLKADGKIRFRCMLCLALLETELDYCAPLDCPGCNHKIFVPQSPFEPDCVIGDFVIRERIGHGALGTVYKAIQISLEREVALKILLPELTTVQVATAFLCEARAAAKLIHINLVLAYAVGEENGIYYMAMNYINGESLKTKLEREGCIPADEALHIVQQVAEALCYAWQEAKLIHRDVKPDNIMITSDGIVKLADLGLAINQAECSKDMEIAGTPIYMSPEQFAGEPLDSRSDIYSLGVTLYQMLSGDVPFQAETVRSMAQQHYTETAAPLNKLRQGIPQKVSSLVKKMMEKLPEDRFCDMEELIKAILAIRQSTAQNSDMVPALHTCSVPRLKYQSLLPLARNLKKGQGEKAYARRLKPYTVKLKASRNRLFWGMVAVFQLLFIVLVFVLLHPATKEPGKTVLLEDRLGQLEKKLTNPKLPLADLTVEAEELLKQFPAKRNPQQETLFWKLKNYIASLTGKIKEQENKITLQKSNSTTETSITSPAKNESLKTDARVILAEIIKT